jgi:hypothetical protein
VFLNVKKHPNTKDDFTLLKKSTWTINFIFKNITNNIEIIDELFITTIKYLNQNIKEEKYKIDIKASYTNIFKKLHKFNFFIQNKLNKQASRIKSKNICKTVKKKIKEITKILYKVFSLFKENKRRKVDVMLVKENNKIKLFFNDKMVNEIKNNWKKSTSILNLNLLSKNSFFTCHTLQTLS